MSAASAARSTARRIQDDPGAILDILGEDTAAAALRDACAAPSLVTADALPEGFDAAATLDALDAAPVYLRGAETEDLPAVRRFLYLRSLIAAAEDELAPLKDRVTTLVLREDGEATEFAGSAFTIQWRRTYELPQEVKDAEDEVKRLKKYHQHEGTLSHTSATLVVKAARR